MELTITESAGETLSQLMENAEHGNFSLRLDMRQINEINKFVLSSSAFVVLVDMEAVMGKDEDTEISYSTTDARLARFVDYLHRWKENDPTSPQIKSVALLGTKYDTVRGEILDNPGFGSKDMLWAPGGPSQRSDLSLQSPAPDQPEPEAIVPYQRHHGPPAGVSQFR